MLPGRSAQAALLSATRQTTTSHNSADHVAPQWLNLGSYSIAARSRNLGIQYQQPELQIKYIRYSVYSRTRRDEAMLKNLKRHRDIPLQVSPPLRQLPAILRPLQQILNRTAISH